MPERALPIYSMKAFLSFLTAWCSLLTLTQVTDWCRVV